MSASRRTARRARLADYLAARSTPLFIVIIVVVVIIIILMIIIIIMINDHHHHHDHYHGPLIRHDCYYLGPQSAVSFRRRPARPRRAATTII